MRNGRPRVLTGIQYLRAVAAFGVFAFHLAGRLGPTWLSGMAGVDIFFVISGFIMWTITAGKVTTPRGFFLDRLRRIAPPYWIVTAVALATKLATPAGRAEAPLWYVIGSFLFVPMRQPGSDKIWPLLVPGWTLNYEMFFYLLFSAALMLPRRLSLAAMAAAMLALAATHGFIDPRYTAPFFYSYPILLEFLAGMLLGWAWRRGLALPLVPALLALFGGLATLVLLGPVPFDELARVAVYGGLAVAVVAGMLGLEARGKVPYLPWLRLLGDASYSFYLWHGFAIGVAAWLCHRLALGNVVLVIVATAIAIGGSIAAYLFIEKPLMRLLRQRRDPVIREATRATGP